MLPLATAGRAPRSIAILGSAAGTRRPRLGHFYPATRIDAVEIDGELLAPAAASSTCARQRITSTSPTPAPLLRAADRRWDVI